MTTKIADDTASIAQRLKEIEAEKMARVMGRPLEGEPTEAPKDIDWTGMYGYPCGYGANAANRFTGTATGGISSSITLTTAQLPPYTPRSLAHPEYPYTGTPHEWRVRIKS